MIGLGVSPGNGKILYLSYCYVGKTHDYRMLKEDFPAQKDWFENFDVRLDSGYQGFARDYKCRQAYLPTKKSKKHPLTDEQKLCNTELARQRIGVEPHRRTDSIGRIKRYRIASDRLRMHDFEKYDDILEVCAGLWNFYIIG